MKLRQMQCLCAVVDSGFNISRAAAILHATQPAVSKQLRLLEGEMCVDLLLRQAGRPVALTEAGERMIVWARRALQCFDNIRSIAREGLGDEGGSMAIAAGHTHAKYLLLPAIVAFNKRYPKVRIIVRQGSPDQIVDLVRDGKVAAGITHNPPDLPDDVAAAPFLSSRRVLVAPAGHPILKDKKLTLETVAAHPVVLLHSTRPQGARIVRKFQDAGLDLNVVVQALDADVSKTYVHAGLGIGVIPDYTYSPRRDPGLRIRDASHLFDPAISTVLLRKESQLPGYVYQFLAELGPALEPEVVQSLVFPGGLR